MTCEHKEFIGLPLGQEPTLEWECAHCNLRMTPGELELYMKLKSIEEMLQRLSSWNVG